MGQIVEAIHSLPLGSRRIGQSANRQPKGLPNSKPRAARVAHIPAVRAVALGAREPLLALLGWVVWRDAQLTAPEGAVESGDEGGVSGGDARVWPRVPPIASDAAIVAAALGGLEINGEDEQARATPLLIALDSRDEPTFEPLLNPPSPSPPLHASNPPIHPPPTYPTFEIRVGFGGRSLLVELISKLGQTQRAVSCSADGRGEGGDERGVRGQTQRGEDGVGGGGGEGGDREGGAFGERREGGEDARLLLALRLLLAAGADANLRVLGTGSAAGAPADSLCGGSASRMGVPVLVLAAGLPNPALALTLMECGAVLAAGLPNPALALTLM
ncbi:hypothetical protein T492DRAFT_831489 [Pavlovales sp. CCMP2436]|nr:hypothetical protein T492DRAFT_831489 [Pavlovales sp. CCMP2436]